MNKRIVDVRNDVDVLSGDQIDSNRILTHLGFATAKFDNQISARLTNLGNQAFDYGCQVAVTGGICR